MSVKGRTPVVDRIEREWQKPFLEVVKEIVSKETLSRAEVARRLNLSQTYFRRLVAGYDLPFASKRQLFFKHKEEKLQNMLKGRIEKGIVPRVEFDGKQMTLAELAKHAGLSYATVAKRYKEGQRLPKLIRPKRERYYPQIYCLGLTVKEWEVIIEYANTKSTLAACRKFSVPKGALVAAKQGRWELIT